ncbi:hypothetical protein CMI38_00385 [Candidatus Pacearchaeota archaeon]|jgi:hypothetical protein|nr:hypothetical protein [Candidatus Pacearchaeota archaeon]|tara:strand:+ start:537 stop:938 length:402 start_codon:yes stop_codon:yes gene_type:complete
MEIKDIITIAISVAAILVTVTIFYLQEPENISPIAIILSVTFVSVAIIGMTMISIWSRWNYLSFRISSNKNEIAEINKSLKIRELYNNMEKRISILEEIIKNKKAQTGIDPRYIYWIVLLVLFLLLLQSLGYF